MPVNASRRWIDELAVLTAESGLDDSEHEEEQPCQETAGQRDQHDVAPSRIEPRMRSPASRHMAQLPALSRLPSLSSRYSAHPRRVGHRSSAIRWAAALMSAALGNGDGGAHVGGEVRIGPTRDAVVAEENSPAELGISMRTIGSRSVSAPSCSPSSRTRASLGPSTSRSSARNSRLTKARPAWHRGDDSADRPSARWPMRPPREGLRSRRRARAPRRRRAEEHRSSPIAAGHSVAQHLRAQ